MNEEIVVILDANQSMGEEISDDGETFLGTTKFDVARYITQELVLHATDAAAAVASQSLDDRTGILALITLGGKQPQTIIRNYSSRNDSAGTKRKRPKDTAGESNETKDWRMNANSNRDCCFSYYSTENDQQSSMDLFLAILSSLCVSSSSSSSRHISEVGDFVTGIVHATDALLKNTTVGASRRRIVLVTDARHKVLVKKTIKKDDDDDDDDDPLDELVDAINRLRAIGCTLEVIGMGFRREKSAAGQGDKVTNNSNKNTDPPETMNATSQAESKSNSNSEDESDGEASDDDDDDGSIDGEETEDDWSDVQEQNELLLIDLVEKLGGCVQAVNGERNNDDSYCVRTVLKRLALASKPNNGPSIPQLPSDGDNKRTFKNNYAANTKVGAIATDENRDSSSLQPSPGMRILYWNGSDDVLLPEWIRVARPSCWSGDVKYGDPSVFCSWIQIDDPLRTSLSTKVTEGAGGWSIYCALENVDAIWEKIAVATAYGKLGPSSNVSSTKHLLQQQQQTTTEINGESCSSCKNPKAVIRVGVKDSTDNTDSKRVFDVLCKDLEVDSSLLTFHINV